MSPRDEQADWLRSAYDQHRRELHAHCYRLTGNVADADDLLQETWLRAWRGRKGFDGRASARTWLYRIATNAFLDSRKAAENRTTPRGDLLEHSTSIGPYPDNLPDLGPESDVVASQMVELAFIVALMHLPARQRAAFVLRDIHGWTPAEIAALLSVSVPAANGLLQRARDTIRRHAPTDPQDWRRPVLTSEDKALLRRYRAAPDIETVKMLLSDEIRITMAPDPPVSGIDAVAAFLTRPQLDWRSFPTTANGRPAHVLYLREPGSPHYVGLVVNVIRILDGRIAEINAFVGAHHIAAFGMPPTLEP